MTARTTRSARNTGVLKVMITVLMLNLGVALAKIVTGYVFDSASVRADGIHSIFDAASNLVALVGIAIAARPADALVSGSVIVGLAFVALGFPFADSIASLVVTVAIFATALSVFKDVQDTFSDEARIKPELVAECALEVDGVRACHEVRSRGLSGEVYVDLHVLVDPAMSILDAHKVADAVEQRVMGRYDQVKEVLVHLEPDVPEEHLASVEEFRSPHAGEQRAIA